MQNDETTRSKIIFPDVVAVGLPAWVKDFILTSVVYPADEDRMRFAIDLSRENVLQGTGGPFGAAVFEEDTGRLVSVGVNSVERLRTSVLHAEVMALILAQATVGSYTLHGPGMHPHMLVTSCEPCAMCLGALLWSGVRRIVCGARREAALAIGFEEGPVFPESHQYLEARGISIVRRLLADEAEAVLRLYQERGGVVYNG